MGGVRRLPLLILAGCVADGGDLLEPNRTPPLEITTEVLAPAHLQEPYEQILEAKGGEQPLVWSLDEGALPLGLTLTPDGVIEGAAAGSGTRFTVAVRDRAGQIAKKAFELDVEISAIAIVGSLPVGTLGQPFVAEMFARGGLGGYTWHSNGTLPAGLSFQPAGAIARFEGTPSESGLFPFELGLEDRSGATIERALVFEVTAPGIVIVITDLPPGRVGVAYEGLVETDLGSETEYGWVAVDLPPGLGIDVGGTPHTTISGIPTGGGTFSSAVSVVDFATGHRAETQLEIQISDLRISTADLPPAAACTTYEARIETELGIEPITFSGTAPPGFTVDSDGVLRGFSLSAGQHPVSITATDATGNSDTKTFQLTIGPEPEDATRWLIVSGHFGNGVREDVLIDVCAPDADPDAADPPPALDALGRHGGVRRTAHRHDGAVRRRADRALRHRRSAGAAPHGDEGEPALAAERAGRRLRHHVRRSLARVSRQRHDAAVV